MKLDIKCKCKIVCFKVGFKPDLWENYNIVSYRFCATVNKLFSGYCQPSRDQQLLFLLWGPGHLIIMSYITKFSYTQNINKAW